MTERIDFSSLFDDAIQSGFGCVLFDMQDDGSGKMSPQAGKGWASANGKEAMRINSPADLATDIRWLTNLDKTTFWKSGAVRMKKLRESSYFKTDLGQLMRETGLAPQKITSAKACEGISEIFSRLMKVAVAHYDLSDIREDEFTSELRPLLLPADTPVDLQVDEALSRAFVDFVLCPASKVEGGRKITLKRPRLAHARQVMDTAIPDGPWEFMSIDALPEESERLDWLISLKRPALLKVAIKGFVDRCPSWAPPLLQLGEAVGAGGHKKERNWMTLQEARYFSRYAKLEIKAVFLAEGWREVNAGKGLCELGELSDLSISLGLIAEAHWLSLASRSRHPVTKSKSMVSPRACWLRATDRFLCFASALPLASAGYSVLSYGMGEVSVVTRPEKLFNLAQIAPACGLTAPAALYDALAKLGKGEGAP